MRKRISPWYLLNTVTKIYSLYALNFSHMNFIMRLLRQVYIESYYLRLYTL